MFMLVIRAKSLEYYEEFVKSLKTNSERDGGAELDVSSLRVTSTLSWDCYVQATKRSRSSLRCTEHSAGKAPKRILVASNMMLYDVMREFDCDAIST